MSTNTWCEQAEVCSCKQVRMSLRQYFKPDPRGSLSEALPSAAIASASNSVPVARVAGLSRARQTFSNSCSPYIFIYMIAMHAAGYLCFRVRDGSVP